MRRWKSESSHEDEKVIALENRKLIRHVNLSEGHKIRSTVRWFDALRNTVAQGVVSFDSPPEEY